MATAPPSKKRGRDSTSGSCDYVNFVVGGRYFSIRSSLIAKYPESYFSSALKKEWRNEHESVINIDRDGSLFEHVVDFHNYGMLPERTVPMSMDAIKVIQDEADFYNMPLMVEACNAFLLAQVCKHSEAIPSSKCLVNGAYDEPATPTDLAIALQKIWTPACYCGLAPSSDVYISPTLNTLRRSIEAMSHRTYRKGQCKRLDAWVIHEAARQFFDNTLYSFGGYFSPTKSVKMSPSHVLLVSQGECIGDVFEHSADETYAGALLYILNSDFEGGEFTVTHNDKTLAISKQYEFMVLANGCPYEHKVVTYGTQMLVAFRISYGEDKEYYELNRQTNNDDYLWEDTKTFNKTVDIYHGREIDGIAQVLGPADVETIHAELALELSKVDALVVSLPHYYPILQCTPDCFTHGDVALYAIIDGFLHSEVGSAFKMSLSLVSLDHNEGGFDEDSSSTVTGTVRDLSFTRSTTDNLKVTLVVPKPCESMVRIEDRKRASTEQTLHLFLGLQITRKTDAELL